MINSNWITKISSKNKIHKLWSKNLFKVTMNQVKTKIGPISPLQSTFHLTQNRKFARKYKRRLPKFQVNQQNKKRDLSIEDYLEEESFFMTTKLIEAAETPEIMREVFYQNKEQMTAEDCTRLISKFITAKNGKPLLSSTMVNIKKDDFSEKETKFIAEAFDHVSSQLEGVSEESLGYLLKSTSLVGALDIEHNLTIYRHYRENNYPLGLYACSDLINHLVAHQDQYDNDLKYVSKSVAIMLSYNGMTSQDLSLRLRLLSALLRSQYAEIETLTILENSILDNYSFPRFGTQEILDVMKGYCGRAVKGANYDLLDLFAHILLRRVKGMSLEDIALMLDYCRRLKYRNGSLLAPVTRVLFNRIIQAGRERAAQLGAPDEVGVIEGEVEVSEIDVVGVGGGDLGLTNEEERELLLGGEE